MKGIPSEFNDLLADETKAFAILATIMEDGSPQITPVWFGTDDENFLVNTEKGRVKDKNMRARPRVALVIPDPHNPYRYLQVRGKVVEIEEKGAREHINTLSKIYLGKPFPLSPETIRVIFKIQPESVDVHT